MGLVYLQEDVKPWLEIPQTNTSADDVLAQCIEGATIFFESHTERVLEEQDLTHQFNGNGNHVMMLREFPVSQVTNVWVSSDWDFSAPIDNTSYVLDNEAFIVRKTVWDQGVRNIAVQYTAGYAMDYVPADLRQAALMMTEFLWKGRADFRLGVTNRSKGGETLTFQESVPKAILDILETYKRAPYVASLLRRAGG